MKVCTSIIAAVLMTALVTVPARGVTDPPSTAQLTVRANTLFNRGEYKTALPILKGLAEAFKDEPARLGPIQEKIRVCEKAIASLVGQSAPPPAPEVQTAEIRKPHAVPKAGELLEMAIKDLGNFDYDQEHGGNIPADVKQLSGAAIRLRGFMIPLDQAANITQFALVPSLFNCCQYGQTPGIQHTIVVQCPKGQAVEYCPDEILVEGKLTVAEKKDDGYIVSIFSVDVKSVKPAPK